MNNNFMTPPMPNNEVIETLNGLVFGNFKISAKEREALARAVTIIENIEADRKNENLPSAEPEIIYCKDCKYLAQEFGWNGSEYMVCRETEHRRSIVSVDDYDYCCYAERRTDEVQNS